jgi:hypothetical protein
MLKNASKVTFVPKEIFSLKILNFVQSFVECKVSLADGTVPHAKCRSGQRGNRDVIRQGLGCSLLKATLPPLVAGDHGRSMTQVSL